MRALLEGPVVEPRAQTRGRPRRQVEVPAAAPDKTPRRGLGESILAGMEVVLGWIATVISVTVQFMLSGAVLLASPLLPFMLPLSLAPAVVFLTLVIYGGAKALSVFALL